MNSRYTSRGGAVRTGRTAPRRTLPYGPLAVVCVVIAIFTVLIAVMLITKPGTGSDHPGLTSFGNAGLALTLCGLGLTIGHLVQLRRV